MPRPRKKAANDPSAHKRGPTPWCVGNKAAFIRRRFPTWLALNRKQRNKMSVVKEGLEVSEVLIQEGVHSFETLNDAVAEPVIYMIDRYVVGGFYRVHTGRGKDENLNAPGMHFEPLAFDTGCNLNDTTIGFWAFRC